MSSVLARDAMTETFNDLHGMILDLVKRFCDRYRMDFFETRSLAYEAFVESFDGRYNPKRGTFTTYVAQKVLSKIYEAHRTLMRRNVLDGERRVYLDLSLIADTNQDKHFKEWVESLHGDAKTVVELVTDAPKEIVHAMVTNYNHAPKVREAVREYLEDIGWNASRIADSFSEVSEALR
jgi:hypothetical protein